MSEQDRPGERAGSEAGPYAVEGGVEDVAAAAGVPARVGSRSHWPAAVQG